MKRNKGPTKMVSFPIGKQWSGWLLLTLFIFQLVAGLLHQLEYHCGSEAYHELSGISLQTISIRAENECEKPAHDSAHCAICQHILNAAFVLLSVILGAVVFGTPSGVLLSSSILFAILFVSGQQSRAPPVISFSN